MAALAPLWADPSVELILRTTATSPFGRKVRIVANVLGLDGRLQRRDADTLDPRDELRRQNALGKMPCLLVDGEAFYDSGVILEMLDELAGGGRLLSSANLPLKRFRVLTRARLADGIAAGASRYRDWVKADLFIQRFEACSEQPGMEHALVDATIVKVHRHGQGAKGGLAESGHRTLQEWHDTKILALTDALGNLVRFVLPLGHRFAAERMHESRSARGDHQRVPCRTRRSQQWCDPLPLHIRKPEEISHFTASHQGRESRSEPQRKPFIGSGP